MIVKTNVKINLGLNVLRRRPDGYHDIETLFVPCYSYGDVIEIITGDDFSRTSARLFAKYSPMDFRLHLDEAPMIAQGISPDGKLMITIAREAGVGWNPLNDLCAKAYELLAKDFKLPPVKIFLEKNAPVGAGLGGGSADAALEYAACLGSDCAFFIFNRPMIGTGRGDILRPLTSVAGQQITSGNIFEKLGLVLRVILPEGISVSTAEAYKGIHPRETADGANRQLKGAETLEMALMRPIEEWKDNIVNDFEVTVFKAHPELAAIKQSLYDAGAAYASMSGSGSALFALYRQ